MLSKFSSIPTAEDLAAATYALRYLRHTANLAIQYNTLHKTLKSPCPLATQTPTSLETLIEKSTSGYVFTILYQHAEQYPHCLCSDNNSKATEPQ